MNHDITSTPMRHNGLATLSHPLRPRCELCGGPRSYGNFRRCFPCDRQRRRDLERAEAAIRRAARERLKLAAEQAEMDAIQ